MGPAITLRIAGLRVRTRLTTPATLAAIAFGITSTAGRTLQTELAFGLLLLITVLVTLALHEATRLGLYRRAGVNVRGIDLALTGGSPSLLERSNSPRGEVTAASGGLIVVALLASGAFAVERLTQSSRSHEVTVWIAVALGALALAQTLPALPLDGGRFLRALVWFLTDDPVQGSRGAAIYGHLVSAGVIVGGLIMMNAGGAYAYWGFGAVIAGLQLVTNSVASMRDTLWQQIGGTLQLADADLPLPGRVQAADTLDQVVDALIEEGHRSSLLVIGADGQPKGVIQLANLRRVRRIEWADHRADEVMTPLAILPSLSGELTALDALTELDRRDSRLAVLTFDGGPTLLVSREMLLDHLLPRAMEQTRQPSSKTP